MRSTNGAGAAAEVTIIAVLVIAVGLHLLGI
jgi:hypothetical protein